MWVALDAQSGLSNGVPKEVLTEPITGYFSSRPGWTSVKYPEEYRRYGTNLVASLIDYLSNTNTSQRPALPEHSIPGKRQELVMLTAQLASDLHVTNAIPFLVSELRIHFPEDEEDSVGSCLIAKLTELTGIKNGYGYHRRWFEESVREAALDDLMLWMKQNRIESGQRE
jgi:hypothetical protein